MIRRRKPRNCPYQDNLTTILYWNAGGYTQNKFTHFQKLLHDNKPDVFAIVEANACTEIDLRSTVTSKGYNMNFLTRSRRVASGIVVGVKSEFSSTFEILHEMTANDKSEVVKVSIWKQGIKTTYIIIYNAPQNQPLVLQNTIFDRNTILVGDLNAPNITYGYNTTTQVGDFIEETLSGTPLILLEDQANSKTYLHHNGSETRPDLVFAHSAIADKTTQTNLIAPTGFDHKVIKVSRVIRHSKGPPNKTKPARWNFKKADWLKFATETNALLTEDTINDNIDRSNKRFITKLLECAKKCIPRGRNENYKPFWNNNLSVLHAKKEEARRKAIETKDETDLKSLADRSKELKEAITTSKRDAFDKFIGKIDYRKDGAKAHRFFSSLCGKNSQKEQKNSPIDYKRKVLTTDEEKAEAHCKHLSSQSKINQIGVEHVKYKKAKYQNSNSTYNQIFTMQEMKAAVKKLSNKKAPGPDKIHPEFIKNMGNIAQKSLLKLLNLSFTTTLPKDWKKALIQPILKKNKNPRNVSSYRPIALTSVLSKVAEYIILARTKHYLESMKILSPHQAGFRDKRSTIDQVASLVQSIRSGLGRSEHTLAVYVDLKEAFDRVRRDMLMKQLADIHLPNNLLRWIQNFLTDRYISVTINKAQSKFRKTKTGVPQGTVVSPTMFNVFINSLPSKLLGAFTASGVKCKLFADDLVIWSSGKNTKLLEKNINTALIRLSEWASSHGQEINIDKTSYEYYTTAYKKLDFNLTYNNMPITESINAIYLGIKMDKKATGKPHFEESAKGSKKRLNLLRRLAGTKWGANKDTLSLTFLTYIRPKLLYGAEIFVTTSDATLDLPEKIQNQALRIINGAVKSTPIAAMQINTNIEPLISRVHVAAILQQEKLLRLTDEEWNVVPPKTLVSYTTFIEKTNKIKLELVPNIDNFDRTPFVTFPYSDTLIEVSYSLNIEGLSSNKSDHSDDFLKASTLELINNKYAAGLWLHVYTDGSWDQKNDTTGSGVYCKHFSISKPAGRNGNIFKAEILAVKLAMQELCDRNITESKIVIFIDSKSAIQAIDNNISSDLDILECRKLYQQLVMSDIQVVLQWIPSHINLYGNDKADSYAKRGLAMAQPQPSSLSFEEVKSMVKTANKNKFKLYSKNQVTKSNWSNIPNKLPYCDRATEVANFRLNTRHHLLGDYLKRFKIREDATCPMCRIEILDRGHLLRCPTLKINFDQLPNSMTLAQKEASNYWLARKNMA